MQEEACAAQTHDNSITASSGRDRGLSVGLGFAFGAAGRVKSTRLSGGGEMDGCGTLQK